MPFGYDLEYEDFQDCVRQNQDKDDPEGYCAWLQQQTEAVVTPTEPPPRGQTMHTAPRTDLVRMHRATRPQLRADGQGTLGTLYGHFAVFNTETLIDSWWEGKFRERIAPGAFSRTINHRGDRVRVLFNHGLDPQVGDKVLGRPSILREDERGVYYEVPLLDTSYNRDLAPGLDADQYGASFRFEVVQEDWEDPPDGTDQLPLRTIREVKLFEFGPVTFPAYEAATAGLRSQADLNLWRSLDEEGRREFLRLLHSSTGTGTPPGPAPTGTGDPGTPHSPVRPAADFLPRKRRIAITLKGLQHHA